MTSLWAARVTTTSLPTVVKGKSKIKTYPNSPCLRSDARAFWTILPPFFKYTPSGNADPTSPFWEDRERGIDAIKKHSDTIESLAKKHGIDPDLVKSIMFMENARGHFYGANDLADTLGLSDTIMPMNINPEIWGGLIGKEPDFNDPTQNIEAATILIKRISDRLENPTPEAIASIWNYLGRETPNDLGAYVQTIYDSKMWEPQTGP